MTIEWALAKRIPDLARNEPVNVGVLLWHDGKVLHRFAPPPRTVDERERALHAHWLTYWKDCAEENRPLSKVAARRPGDGYYLEVAGEMLTTNKPVEPLALLDELFDELVVNRRQPAARGGRFRQTVDRLIDDSGLRERREFHTEWRVTLTNGQNRRFDYAYVNGHTTLGYRLNTKRDDFIDACFHRLDRTPSDFGCVLFVPEETEETALKVLEREVVVAQVGSVSAQDVREMFERQR